MRAIEPEMVLGKEALDTQGGSLGEIVDVGLYAHDRVKFLVVKASARGVPVRTFAVDAIRDVSVDTVRVAVG